GRSQHAALSRRAAPDLLARPRTHERRRREPRRDHRRVPGERTQPRGFDRRDRAERAVPHAARRAERGVAVKRVPWLDRDRARRSRRTFLRAAGAAIALPYLEAMWPASARAQAAASARRFLAWYVPNGINMADWTPSTTGASYALTPILTPLANVRN